MFSSKSIASLYSPKITLASKSSPTAADCPKKEYLGPFGVIVSPKWPNIYSPQATCDYSIEVASGKKIKLIVNYFETESNWDYMMVYDGKSAEKHRLIT
jgi:hypothetical protein